MKAIKQKAQMGLGRSGDSCSYQGDLSQSRVMNGTVQPKKRMPHDGFSRKKGLMKGGPMKGNQ